MNREPISQAEIVGRLGQRPELEHTTDGTAFTRLSVATSDRYTDKGGEIHEKTEWHRAVAWGPVAEQIANQFDKGDSVALTGAMRINSYEKDGAKNRTIELHVDKAEPNPDKQLSKNEARLVGVLREDAKTRTLDSGTAMTVLSIATTTMANGKEREDWQSVTLWGKTAEAARDIKAGDSISVNGSIRHRSVPGPEGQERKLSAIDCRHFQVLERAVDRGQQPAPAPAKDQDCSPAMPPPAEPTRSRGRQRGKGVERGM
jgi:single-stranded DNA-binding protein